MIILKTIFCIGMLAVAGAFGVFLGWLEKHFDEERKWDK